MKELLITLTDCGISERSTAMRVKLSEDLPTKLLSFSDFTSKDGSSTVGPLVSSVGAGAAASSGVTGACADLPGVFSAAMQVTAAMAATIPVSSLQRGVMFGV